MRSSVRHGVTRLWRLRRFMLHTVWSKSSSALAKPGAVFPLARYSPLPNFAKARRDTPWQRTQAIFPASVALDKFLVEVGGLFVSEHPALARESKPYHLAPLTRSGRAA